MQKITKLVIPAAGSGTRFLPATKAIPKEMLPIVDKPIIQYVVEEAVESGIKDIIIVTGWHKRAVEDHFDRSLELERRLIEAEKEEQLKEIQRIATLANFIYVRQKGPYGNATPVLCAKEIVGNEPFAVLWGDEFIHASPPRLKQCIDVFYKYKNPVISGVRVSKKDVSRYGIGKIKPVKGNVYRLEGIVEKPTPEKAPSDIAVHGAYVLTPDIFPILEKLKPGKAGELWLPDAITALSKKRPVYACLIENGHYHDCGSKLDFIKANVLFGLEHPETKAELKKFLKELV